MALTVQQLQAIALQAVALVNRATFLFPPERRDEVSTTLINELLINHWRGIPGETRKRGLPPEPTDIAAAQVFAAVNTVWRRRVLRGAPEGR